MRAQSALGALALLGSQVVAALLSFSAPVHAADEGGAPIDASVRAERGPADKSAELMPAPPRASAPPRVPEVPQEKTLPLEARTLSVPLRAPGVMQLTPLTLDRLRPSLDLPARRFEPSGVRAPNDPARLVAPYRSVADTVKAQMAQRRLFGYIAGSLGLAGIGVGATTSVMALGKTDSLDRQCADPIRICSPDGKARGGGVSLSAVSAAGWAVGVLGLGTGLLLILSSDSKSGKETALGPKFYHGGAGLRVRRTF